MPSLNYETENGSPARLNLVSDSSVAIGISNLIKLRNKVVESKQKSIAGMCVITAGKESYTDPKSEGTYHCTITFIYRLVERVVCRASQGQLNSQTVMNNETLHHHY